MRVCVGLTHSQLLVTRSAFANSTSTSRREKYRPASRARTPRLHPLVYQSMRVAAAARAHGTLLARATCSGPSARPASAGRPLPQPFLQLHGWRSATRPPPITTTSFTYRVPKLIFNFFHAFSLLFFLIFSLLHSRFCTVIDTRLKGH